MREDWVEVQYQETVFKIPTSKQKLKQKEYSQSGEFPVVDQGQELVGGYSDDAGRLLVCKLPVIVFGDHTKCVKLINFKFVPGADGTKVLQPKLNIEPKYLSYLTHVLVHKIKDKGYARHYQHLEKENFPLAPLVEQRVIVAKIETLFSDLDKGIADLKTAQAQLKIYRQAVLKKAFEGELTKQWRDTNKIIYGWTNVNLSDISDSCLGKMLDKAKNKGLLKPYLGNINVRWGKFNTDSLKTMRIEDSEHVRFQLIKGDLVICEGGEPGRCAVWQSDESIFIQKALHRVRFKANCNSYYFYYYFFYQAKIGGLNAYFTGTTIKHLTGRKLKEFKVPFCSIKEQNQIVREIESRLSVCDKVEQTITESLEKAKALRQSILKKAFEGSLLSAAEIEQCKQDPDYEPAAALLAKIKAEKSKK